MEEEEEGRACRALGEHRCPHRWVRPSSNNNNRRNRMVNLLVERHSRLVMAKAPTSMVELAVACEEEGRCRVSKSRCSNTLDRALLVDRGNGVVVVEEAEEGASNIVTRAARLDPLQLALLLCPPSMIPSPDFARCATLNRVLPRGFWRGYSSAQTAQLERSNPLDPSRAFQITEKGALHLEQGGPEI